MFAALAAKAGCFVLAAAIVYVLYQLNPNPVPANPLEDLSDVFNL